VTRRRAILVALFLGVIAFTTGSRLLAGAESRHVEVTASAAPQTTAAVYSRHFSSPRHERMFLASLAFFVTFAATRAITHAIRAGRGPFHDVETSGGHLHHLVWGILLLLGIGYLWLIQVGTGGEGGAAWASPVTALLFGAGAALTLDEFALWLTFRDVYWEREGRLSVDAVVVFGSLLSIGLWGGPFFRDLFRLWTRAA
jgi:hypothetical protein